MSSLTDMIKQWEYGKHGISARYRALLKEAGIDLSGPVPSRRSLLTVGLGLTGLTLAAPHLGDRIGDSTIARLRERANRLRNLDDYLGGTDTYPLYLAELTTTTRLLASATYDDVTGRALQSLSCEQGQQAGWAAFDAGWLPQANRHFTEARDAAVLAGDLALAGNCLAYIAYQASMTGGTGMAEATAAHETAGPSAPGQVRALLLERAAWSHAVRGDETLVDQTLGQAYDALTDARQESPHWASWVDDVELQIMTGRCWAELGRPLRAVPALEAGLARYDDAHARDKALYLTWLATAYLDGHELQKATETLERAMQLATGVASVRPAKRIHTVLNRFEDHAAEPLISELLDRGREWLTEPSYG